MANEVFIDTQIGPQYEHEVQRIENGILQLRGSILQAMHFPPGKPIQYPYVPDVAKRTIFTEALDPYKRYIGINGKGEWITESGRFVDTSLIPELLLIDVVSFSDFGTDILRKREELRDKLKRVRNLTFDQENAISDMIMNRSIELLRRYLEQNRLSVLLTLQSMMQERLDESIFTIQK